MLLNIFRKYQKVVFGLISVVLIVSLTFFGSYNAFLQRPAKEHDYNIGSAIDGSLLTYQQVEKIVRFISTDKQDGELAQKGLAVNYFNYGVIRKDFLEGGLASLLVDAYFDNLKKDFDDRLLVQKRFEPYKHPDVESLSAENIWSQFLPQVNEELQEIKKQDFVSSPESFQVISNLYLSQAQFPSYLLRRFLSYQEGQYQGIRKDPFLREGDLTLFGFYTLQDWFGENFVRLVAEFIHNASIHAVSKGYKVTFEEARADLLRNGYEVLKAQQNGKEISPEMLAKQWKKQLEFLHLDEKSAVEVWQKVLLYKKYFDDYGNSVFMDRLSYQNYSHYTSESIEIESFTLPKEIALNTLEELALHETYLSAIANGESNELFPPQNFKDTSQVAEENPSLVEKNFEIELVHTTLDEVALNVGLKRMWDWQAEPANFAKLKKKFSEIGALEAKLQKDPTEILEELDENIKARVDSYSRREIVTQDPSFVHHALQEKQGRDLALSITLDGKQSVLDGINDGMALLSLLEKSAVKDEELPSELFSSNRQKLENYSQDGENFYRIYLLTNDSPQKVLTFAELKGRKSALNDLLDQKLKPIYSSIKKTEPETILGDNGQIKDFESVKDTLIKKAYKDLLVSIEESYVKAGNKLIFGYLKEPASFYAQHRYFGWVSEIQNNLSSYCKDHAFFKEGDDYKSQFHVLRVNQDIQRKEKSDMHDEQVFALEEGIVSQVKASDNGSLYFFKVLNKHTPSKEKISKEIHDGQSLLSIDAKKFLMSELITKIIETDSIHLDTFQSSK